jgi:hypothetical protein
MKLKTIGWNKIIDAYNEELIGTKFVYATKYRGYTFGEIASVFTSTSLTWDKETSKLFSWSVRKSKGIKPERDPNVPKFSGWNNTIHIKTTNGIVYELSELILLNEDLDITSELKTNKTN